MVEGDGFEPSKAEPADLQSAPFGHSGTPPNFYATSLINKQFSLQKSSHKGENGADYRNRTGDLLITSQLLYLLS